MASIPKEPAFVKKQWEIEPESATPVAQQGDKSLIHPSETLH